LKFHFAVAFSRTLGCGLLPLRNKESYRSLRLRLCRRDLLLSKQENCEVHVTEADSQYVLLGFLGTTTRPGAIPDSRTPATGYLGIHISCVADIDGIHIASLGAVEVAFLGRDCLPPERSSHLLWQS